MAQDAAKLLPLGTRVNHDGHGLGTIVAYNGQQRNTYLEDNLPFVASAAVPAGLGSSVINSFYSADRFPYVVQYDKGYKDVYDVDGQVLKVVET